MKEWHAVCEPHKSKLIASFLTMQDVIAGIGNKYRSEIMHVSNIPPSFRVSELSKEQREILLVVIYRILKASARNEYNYTVYGLERTVSGDPIERVEVARGIYVWSTYGVSKDSSARLGRMRPLPGLQRKKRPKADNK